LRLTKYTPLIGMAFMLLLVQLIAIALTKPLDKEEFRAFQDPGDVTNVFYWIAIILVFTAFILVVIRMNKKWIIQAFIFITVAWTLYIVFTGIFTIFLSLETTFILSIVLSVTLTGTLYKFPEWYVIDIIGLLIGAGAATIFGNSLEIIPVLVLLILLAVYDYIAVYRTKHMVTLAEGIMDLRLPILLVVPKKWNYSFLSEKFDKEEREAFFMGLGDAVIPTVLVVSAISHPIVETGFYAFPLIGAINIPAIGAIIGTFVGFFVLMGFVMKGKPQAGLPFLNGGVILGYIVGSLIAGSPLL